MVVALLALLVALGGGAYAALKLPNNSVTGADVKNGSLGPEDVENIIQSPKSKDSVTTGAAGVEANDPLKNASWSQAKGEIDQLVLTVRYESPASCGGTVPFNEVNFSLDGTQFVSAFLTPSPAGSSHTTTISYLVPKASDKTKHELKAKAIDNCTGGSENFTIKSVKGNVLAFR
jgi:hypothetical protein